MQIQKIITGPVDTNSYILYQNNKAILIDYSGDFDSIFGFLKQNNLQLEKILITHLHFDHILNINHLKNKTNTKIYANKKDLILLNNQKEFYNFPLEINIDHNLKDNEIINFEDIKLKIIETPGHSPGSVCFYLASENLIFSGDLLFKNGFGRYDLPYGNLVELRKSLKKILELPKETIVYPGHGENTKIKDELKVLRFI